MGHPDAAGTMTMRARPFGCKGKNLCGRLRPSGEGVRWVLPKEEDDEV